MVRIGIDINDVIRDYTGQFIKCYKKMIDPKFEKEVSDIESFDFVEEFNFGSESEYQDFKYTDAAFEIHARAEMKDSRLYGALTDWVDNVLKSLDIDEDPEVFYFSPFELGLTIPSTLSFLASHGLRVREYYFPINSMEMYNKCDIMITANPNLISKCPEGKKVFKINTAYNKDVESEFSFDSLYDVIKDPEEKIIKEIEKIENDTK
jgi:hypothetical protein